MTSDSLLRACHKGDRAEARVHGLPQGHGLPGQQWEHFEARIPKSFSFSKRKGARLRVSLPFMRELQLGAERSEALSLKIQLQEWHELHVPSSRGES